MTNQSYSSNQKQKKGNKAEKPKTKKEKQLGMTPKEGADDDNPAM